MCIILLLDSKLIVYLDYSFGKVYLVRPHGGDSREVYAMKILKKSEVCKRHQVEHTRTERKIMAEISVRTFMYL